MPPQASTAAIVAPIPGASPKFRPAMTLRANREGVIEITLLAYRRHTNAR